MNDLLIIAGAWFIGAFINGLTGMGGTLIALPLISLFVSSKDVILISLISGTLVGTMTMVFYWRHIDVREVLGFWLPAIPGIALGVWTLKVVDIEVLELLLCILIVVHIVVQLIQDWLGTCMAPRAVMKYVCGFVAGFFGGAIGINGPIMAIYASLMCMEKNRARGSPSWPQTACSPNRCSPPAPGWLLPPSSVFCAPARWPSASSRKPSTSRCSSFWPSPRFPCSCASFPPSSDPGFLPGSVASRGRPSLRGTAAFSVPRPGHTETARPESRVEKTFSEQKRAAAGNAEKRPRQ